MEHNLSFFHVADLSFPDLCNKSCDLASSSICFEHLTLAKLPKFQSPSLRRLAFPYEVGRRQIHSMKKTVQVGLKLIINHLLSM